MHRELGNAALQGWRQKVADRVAPAVSRRTPLDEEDVGAILGLAFLALTVRYLVRTVRGALGTSGRGG
jgi:hypothetical protein